MDTTVTASTDRAMTALRSRRAVRRLVAGGTLTASAALIISASAWACVLRNDVTLKVFSLTNYPSGTCATVGSPAGSACSKTVGNATQTGLATVDTAGDDVLHLAGNGFTDATGDTNYFINWRHPGSTSNCHEPNVDGSVVAMGGTATVTSSGVLDATRTAITTTGRSPETGLARICVQDYYFDGGTPTVVIGQFVDVSVV